MHNNLTSYTKSIVEKGGAKFDGIQKIRGKYRYALATDFQTGSTYYLPIRGLTKDKIRTKMLMEREKYLNVGKINP